MLGIFDAKRTPRIIVITYGQAGERRPGDCPLFVYLFVMHIPMLIEIYAYVEAVGLGELMVQSSF